MTDNPATPAAGDDVVGPISFDDLFWRIDSNLISARTWLDVCEREAKAATLAGDADGAETYRAAWRTHRRHVAQYERLQTLITRIAKSGVIKAELARIAAAEKQAADAGAREIGDEAEAAAS